MNLPKDLYKHQTDIDIITSLFLRFHSKDQM